MREKKFTRIAAFLLALVTMAGSFAVVASAADDPSNNSSVTDTSMEELRELLNAITYEEYREKYSLDLVYRPKDAIEVPISEFVAGEGDEGIQMVQMGEGESRVDILQTPSNGTVSWEIDVPVPTDPAYTSIVSKYNLTGLKYAIKIEYYPDQNRATSIERILKINDKVPFSEARFLTMPKRWVNDYVDVALTPAEGETAESLHAEAVRVGYADAYIKNGKVVLPYPDFVTADMANFAETRHVRFFQRDINNNEIRPTTVDVPEFMTYYLKDSTGYNTASFEFVLEPGKNTITLEGQNEPMSIKSITLYPLNPVMTYAEYEAQYKDKAPGKDVVKIEAELPTVMSNKTIYPVEDRSCAINSPTDTTCSVLNTIGGEKWATAGQWVEYRFQVGSSGMYDIYSRFRQNVLDGMYTCRSMYLYSEGIAEGADGYYNGAPFEEALKLVYDYSDDWQVTGMTGGDKNYSVYLEANKTYTIRFEVTLGKMGDVVRRVQNVLNSINNDYLNIIKLTGLSPDKYRDYGFSQVMPDVMIDLVIQANELDAVAEELTKIAGGKSSNVATLEKVSRLLREMGQDDDAVAKNLSNLKTYIGTLGTFLSDAQTQPLQLDYLQIQPKGSTEKPKATPNFFQSFVHEVKGFFQSFFRDYDSMGAMEESKENSTEVWLATARDQSQVIRSLINNDFTPNQGIAVDLKLVAAGTLLPSILADAGPDVYLGLPQGDVINYAIRSALTNIDSFPDFKDYTQKNFNDAAMLVLGIEDADEQLHYYGLPETQAFPMMFVRTDVLADLNLETPKTWDDLMACIPTLQANNMQIGLTTDFKIFLYQQEGGLFADDGMRINLVSKTGLAAFEKMCNLFTMYSFPYQYDAANRFRTGEMPILLGDYTATYNQLKVFATEIEGKWQFVPLPGEIRPDGSINNVSISAVTATVMIKGCEGDDKERAWKFMKWYTGADCQIDFSNEMVAILGPSAKQSVSNRNALEGLPWTTAELKEVMAQFQNLGSVPNYPGAYIVDRYTNFAFLSAYNNNADPADSMLSYINTINKEIERKRDEFNLETLSDGENDYKDLLTKRIAQLTYLVDTIRDSSAGTKYAALLSQIESALTSDDMDELNAALEAVAALYKELDPDGSIVKADRKAVMGYDMNDTSLTKAQKKKMRKCFSYEVYRNTSKLETRVWCMADYLSDVINIMEGELVK